MPKVLECWSGTFFSTNIHQIVSLRPKSPPFTLLQSHHHALF
jgi:hypothetical protein